MSKASTNKRERRSIIQVSLRGPGLAAIARDLRGLAQKVYVCTYMYVYVYVCTCMLCYVCHPRAQKHEAKRAILSIELSRLLESINASRSISLIRHCICCGRFPKSGCINVSRSVAMRISMLMYLSFQASSSVASKLGNVRRAIQSPRVASKLANVRGAIQSPRIVLE